MTCWFDPSQGTFDAYDHTGTLVAEDVEVTDSWSSDDSGRLVDAPRGFLDVLYDARDGGGQPTAYNQELLFCLGAEQFQVGTPPA